MTDHDPKQPNSKREIAQSPTSKNPETNEGGSIRRPLRQARFKSMDYLSYDQALDYTISQIKKQSAKEYKKQQTQTVKRQQKNKTELKKSDARSSLKQKTLPILKEISNYTNLGEEAKKHPDNVYTSSTAFKAMSRTKETNFSKVKPKIVEENCSILGLAITYDGNIIAAFTQLGFVKLYDTSNYELICVLYDYEETQIDEYYVGQFSLSQKYLVVGGKRKDRAKWCSKDDDNHILPCTIKVFDIVEGLVIDRLNAHSEEVLDIQWAIYKEEMYFVSSSQDGSIYRWKVTQTEEWKVKEKRKFNDNMSCMSFALSFLPNTANRIIVACCDDSLMLFDFESLNVIKTFEDLYSSYLDHAQLIPSSHKIYGSEIHENCAFLITRGVELLDLQNNTVASRPNKCTLHKIEYPNKHQKEFTLTEVKQLMHEHYLSNSWLIKISAYGDCIYAPTNNGKIFVYNIISSHVENILRNHLDVEVRQLLINPKNNDVYTCGDDGRLCIYSYKTDEEAEISITD